MKKLNWGMLGTGWIAHEMGEALQRVNGEIYACCARSIESAEKYAKEFGVKHVYGRMRCLPMKILISSILRHHIILIMNF